MRLYCAGGETFVKTHPTVCLIFVPLAVHKTSLNKINVIKNHFWSEGKIPCLRSHTVESQPLMDLAGLSHFTVLEPLGSPEKALPYHPADTAHPLQTFSKGPETFRKGHCGRGQTDRCVLTNDSSPLTTADGGWGHFDNSGYSALALGCHSFLVT